jgi:hypothetical protein
LKLNEKGIVPRVKPVNPGNGITDCETRKPCESTIETVREETSASGSKKSTAAELVTIPLPWLSRAEAGANITSVISGGEAAGMEMVRENSPPQDPVSKITPANRAKTNLFISFPCALKPDTVCPAITPEHFRIGAYSSQQEADHTNPPAKELVMLKLMHYF